MSKFLYIAEKPSVAQEFAKALKISGSRRDGYIESDDAVVTWCVGHLVTMSYPAAYDEKYRRWSLDTLPFLPKEWKYEVIDSVKKQYRIVSGLMKREDISRIYVCTDSGREGEYIYRLVEQMAGAKGKERRRVWIDSQTEEEILRGIREAKDLSEYDNLSNAAYLRAKEDYLMGINFSRLLTLRYGSAISDFQHMEKRAVVSVGRVMTCVLGMVVRREREIRSFVKTPFYRVLLTQELDGKPFDAELRAVEGSAYYQSPLLYKENGFQKREDAEALCAKLKAAEPQLAEVVKIERKKEQKYAPLLFNLAELQNECSRRFHISPDETLKITQELYEKKLVTYPRTDARVLSSAVAKEIYKNIGGLRNYAPAAGFASEVLEKKSWQGIAKSRYVNDKQITDHYAIVPTGQGLAALARVASTGQQVYDLIVRRFLSIFYPPAVYQKAALVTRLGGEQFFANFRILMEEGYLAVAPNTFEKKKKDDESEETGGDAQMLEALMKLRKGAKLPVRNVKIREGETTPPKRYNSGSMILAMENAGQLIEDEELRAQIKGSGIGTSATRAEILNKLVKNKYIALNKKTQIISPTLLGENIFDVVNVSIRSLLNPELTASWEKGLTYVAEGQITPEEYMGKLENFVSRHTQQVKESRQHTAMRPYFEAAAVYYKKEKKK
ncbi:MAG: DNA topoisomerase [Lachnospiraceae bacterium]|nr:DNA topoisomerase [Lachnospiraceae bacterium]